MAKNIVSKPEKEQFPARVERALIDLVREEARQHRRTLGAELEMVIEEGLQARGVLPVSKPGVRRVA
jgi:hypothetical protein